MLGQCWCTLLAGMLLSASKYSILTSLSPGTRNTNVSMLYISRNDTLIAFTGGHMTRSKSTFGRSVPPFGKWLRLSHPSQLINNSLPVGRPWPIRTISLPVFTTFYVCVRNQLQPGLTPVIWWRWVATSGPDGTTVLSVFSNRNLSFKTFVGGRLSNNYLQVARKSRPTCQ